MNAPVLNDQIAAAKALKAKFYPTTPPVVIPVAKRASHFVRVTRRSYDEVRIIRAVVYTGRVYGPFELDESFAEFFARHFEDSEPQTTKRIVAMISRRHNIPVADILSPSRLATHVAARQEAMAAIYLRMPELSLPRIARVFNRDHTTVLHAIKKLGVWRGGAQS
jgi:chromosomal replication initiation ATPase DnaA